MPQFALEENMSPSSRIASRRFGSGFGLHRLWQKLLDFYRDCRPYGRFPLLVSRVETLRMGAAASVPQSPGDAYELHFLPAGNSGSSRILRIISGSPLAQRSTGTTIESGSR